MLLEEDVGEVVRSKFWPVCTRRAYRRRTRQVILIMDRQRRIISGRVPRTVTIFTAELRSSSISTIGRHQVAGVQQRAHLFEVDAADHASRDETRAERRDSSGGIAQSGKERRHNVVVTAFEGAEGLFFRNQGLVQLLPRDGSP